VSAPFGLADSIVSALAKAPTELWTLMTVGVGAFGASRGVEKGIAAWGKKK